MRTQPHSKQPHSHPGMLVSRVFLWARSRPRAALLLALLLAAGAMALDYRSGPTAHTHALLMLPVVLAAAAVRAPLPCLLILVVFLSHVGRDVQWAHAPLHAHAISWVGEGAFLLSLLLAAHLGVALRRSLALEQRQTRILNGLGLVTTTMASSLDLRQVLETTLAQAQRVTHAEPIGIWLLDRGRTTLHLEAATAHSPRRRIRVDATRVPLGSPHILARCVSAQGALMLGAEDAGTADADRLFVGHARSLVVIPLIARGTAVGALAADLPSRDRHLFQVLQDMANSAAIAIDNARLFEETLRARVALESWSQELERRVEEKTHALETAQRDLLRAERLASIGELAATVAHELRNPLNVIKVAHFALSQGERPERERRHLDAIGRQVGASTRIINALLDFARDAPLDVSPVNLSVLANEVLVDLILPARIGLQVELDSEMPTIGADRGRLAQVLVNLLDNAIRAMPEEGVLAVRVFHDSEWLCVSVRDTGVGIPPEVRAHIFEPLFTTRTKGAGLGLAIARRIADAHQGEIRVESEPGVGSTFTLALRAPGCAGPGGAGESAPCLQESP